MKTTQEEKRKILYSKFGAELHDVKFEVLSGPTEEETRKLRSEKNEDRRIKYLSDSLRQRRNSKELINFSAIYNELKSKAGSLLDLINIKSVSQISPFILTASYQTYQFRIEGKLKKKKMLENIFMFEIMFYLFPKTGAEYLREVEQGQQYVPNTLSNSCSNNSHVVSAYKMVTEKSDSKSTAALENGSLEDYFCPQIKLIGEIKYSTRLEKGTLTHDDNQSIVRLILSTTIPNSLEEFETRLYGLSEIYTRIPQNISSMKYLCIIVKNKISLDNGIYLAEIIELGNDKTEEVVISLRAQAKNKKEIQKYIPFLYLKYRCREIYDNCVEKLLAFKTKSPLPTSNLKSTSKDSSVTKDVLGLEKKEESDNSNPNTFISENKLPVKRDSIKSNPRQEIALLPVLDFLAEKIDYVGSNNGPYFQMQEINPIKGELPILTDSCFDKELLRNMKGVRIFTSLYSYENERLTYQTTCLDIDKRSCYKQTHTYSHKENIKSIALDLPNNRLLKNISTLITLMCLKAITKEELERKFELEANLSSSIPCLQKENMTKVNRIEMPALFKEFKTLEQRMSCQIDEIAYHKNIFGLMKMEMIKTDKCIRLDRCIKHAFNDYKNELKASADNNHDPVEAFDIHVKYFGFSAEWKYDFKNRKIELALKNLDTSKISVVLETTIDKGAPENFKQIGAFVAWRITFKDVYSALIDNISLKI